MTEFKLSAEDVTALLQSGELDAGKTAYDVSTGILFISDDTLAKKIKAITSKADWQSRMGNTSPVPDITARQLRLWLLGKGVEEADVLGLISKLPEDDRKVAEIEWEYATNYVHDHPFIQQLGAALGMTPEQIDEGFREAAQL